MKLLKSIWKFLSSMQFAIILLVILIAACAVGSFVTQGQSYSWYAAAYGERAAGAILALRLDDAFHSWWFIVITAFLCLNLLLCNLLRLPSMIKRTRRIPGGRDAVRRKAGIWGAWICHLGVLLIILGFGFGQMLKQEYTVYGVPGESKAIGDTGYIITIDSFDIDLRDDDTVRQYTAGITVRNAARAESESAEISVNNPASLFGMRFYQNSTGWAADVHVTKDGEPLQDEVICAGDYIAVKDKPELVIYFNAFYPDYELKEGVGPSTKSSKLNNPAYLYSVYYREQMLGMNALLADEKVTIDEYAVTFSDPQNYTLIQIKRDPLTPVALLGGLVTLLGLFIAFYIKPVAVPEEHKNREMQPAKPEQAEETFEEGQNPKTPPAEQKQAEGSEERQNPETSPVEHGQAEGSVEQQKPGTHAAEETSEERQANEEQITAEEMPQE